MSSTPLSAARSPGRSHHIASRCGLLLSLCAPLVIVSAVSSWGGPMPAKASLSLDEGSAPFSVAMGDLNGDGKPDLAVANHGSSAVSVLLGKGDGRFAAKVDYGTGSQPYSVAIGDVSGDGKPDLAVANWGSNTVSILLGTGDGTFGMKVDYGTGINPRSVVIGDVSADGKPDLSVADSGLAAESGPLRLTGRRVRLLAPELGARKVTGTVAEVHGDTLLFTADKQSTRSLVRIQSLTGLEVYRGASTHVLAGMGIGLLGGALVGGLIGNASVDPADELGGLVILFGTVVGGGVGIIAGAIVGSRHTERWESQRLPISIGFLPSAHAIELTVGLTSR